MALSSVTNLRDAIYDELKSDDVHKYIWGNKPDMTGETTGNELRVYKELYPGQRTVALRQWVGIQYRANGENRAGGSTTVSIQFNFYAEQNVDPVVYEDQAYKILEIAVNVASGLSATPLSWEVTPARTPSKREFLLLSQKFKVIGGY